MKIPRDLVFAFYQKRLNLPLATFSRVEHEDAIVAIVYRITHPNGIQLILKICANRKHYLRETHFLKYFENRLPVPHIIQLVEPEKDVHGAILMECLPGRVLKKTELNVDLAYEVGRLLAMIHTHSTSGYGDVFEPENLSSDPRTHFSHKFEEGLQECQKHLPKNLIDQCRSYMHQHLNLLEDVDGPCFIHRDFRPGNLIIHEGQLQGIIDWSSSRASFAEEDFCPLELNEWSDHPNIKNSFLKGYASIRQVPNYNEIMPLLKLSRTIATIGYTFKTKTWRSKNARLYQSNRKYLDDFF